VRDYNTSSLSEAIMAMLKSYRLDKKVTETELYQSWEALMGSSINKHTQSIQLRDKVLIIRLDSSALRHELGFAKDKIVDKINEHVGFKFVDEVLLM